MIHKWSIGLVILFISVTAWSQSDPIDSIAATKDTLPINKNDTDLFTDTSINYDELFRDFDAFMDSVLTPQSNLLASLSVGKGYYNFETKGTSDVRTEQKLNYLPTLAYYHKDGFGLSASGYIVNDETGLNFYQFSFSPAFDFLKNKNFATGLSFTKFITRDSLPFYTSPLQNEIYAYFTYRKPWIRPTISLSYGWGSRNAYEKREVFVQDLRLRRRGYTYVNTTETVSDFSLIASVRHDFYWLNIFTYKDHIRLTPQFAFTSGTQKFGFNQTSNTYTYGPTVRNVTSNLYSSENIYLDDFLDFQPLSLTLYLRGEYSIGRFFIQPQLSLDYYFPAPSKNFSALFSINTGLIF